MRAWDALRVSGLSFLTTSQWQPENGAFGIASAFVGTVLIAGVALLVAFCLWELRAAEPILSMRLFRHPVLARTFLLSFLLGPIFYGAAAFVPATTGGFERVIQSVFGPIAGRNLADGDARAFCLQLDCLESMHILGASVPGAWSSPVRLAPVPVWHNRRRFPHG